MLNRIYKWNPEGWKILSWFAYLCISIGLGSMLFPNFPPKLAPLFPIMGIILFFVIIIGWMFISRIIKVVLDFTIG